MLSFASPPLAWCVPPASHPDVPYPIHCQLYDVVPVPKQKCSVCAQDASFSIDVSHLWLILFRTGFWGPADALHCLWLHSCHHPGQRHPGNMPNMTAAAGV